MAIGLAQGLLLCTLYYHWMEQAWLAHYPMLFHCLLLCALLLPPLGISALSHMRPCALGLWLLLLSALIIGVAISDFWRTDIGAWLREPALSTWQNNISTRLEPSMQVLLLVPTLFIAQTMALAGHQDRRWVTRYPSYFAWGWKLALQIALAFLFDSALWKLLFTGALLLDVAGISVPIMLIKSPWFLVPGTTLAYAAALHLSDVKPAIIVTLRRALLGMLSWLLPLAVVIVTGVLAGLCAIGLQPLWESRHAAALLLGATALLVMLINVVYQDGLSGQIPAPLISWCLHLACALLLPLVALATYALDLRVSQYGWTPERIHAAVCIAVASIYALGYLAALRRSADLGAIAPVNVGAGFAILAVLVLLLTPLADPARLAVADQMARLRSGQITPQQLDVRFLRDRGQRYGARALADIAASQEPALAVLSQQAQRALETLPASEPTPLGRPGRSPRDNIRMHPQGATLPAAITTRTWQNTKYGFMVPGCLYDDVIQCDAYFIRPPGAAHAQVLIIDPIELPTVLAEDSDGQWQILGTFPMSASCLAKLREALEADTLQWKASPRYDLSLGKTRIPMVHPPAPSESCDH